MSAGTAPGPGKAEVTIFYDRLNALHERLRGVEEELERMNGILFGDRSIPETAEPPSICPRGAIAGLHTCIDGLDAALTRVTDHLRTLSLLA